MTGPAASTTAGPRLAAFYGAVFGAVGVQLPFWPVWLESRGLDAEALGLVLAAGLWAKVTFNPVAARLADRSGERRRVMVGLAAAAALGVALFAFAHGLWALLALTAFTTACFSSLMPLGDSLTLLHARRGGAVDYGRVRLWGSLTFIVAAVLGGRLLGLAGTGGADVILALMAGAYALVLLACVLLPPEEEVGSGPGEDDGATPAAPRRSSTVRRLLADPRFLLVLAGAGLIQASHSAYYAFATLHWRAAGHDEAVIGWLWAEGVIAEVALFAWGRTLLRTLGARRLLVIAGLVTAVRWALTALSTELALLLIVQTLHAASFAATHLAAVHEVQRIAPPGLSATAQGLYAAYGTGALVGLIMPATGWLYGAFGGGAFHAMALLALLGAGLAALLARQQEVPGRGP